MAESDLSKRLRHLVTKEADGPNLYRRIEDASGNLGTHDVHIIHKGMAMWVELKDTETPGAAPQMRQGQTAYARAVRKAGGRSWFLVSDHRSTDVRLLHGDCRGPDWRDHLKYHGPLDLTLWHLMWHS